MLTQILTGHKPKERIREGIDLLLGLPAAH